MNISTFLRERLMVLTNEEADRILSGKEKAYTIDELVSLLGISKARLKDGEEMLNAWVLWVLV